MFKMVYNGAFFDERQLMRSSNATQYGFFKDSISPLSINACNRLQESAMFGKVADTINHFNLLIGDKVTTLNSLHSRTPLKTKAFIKDLNKRAKRMGAAIESNAPYNSFFGDLCMLKEQLQVILGYYQSQLETDGDKVRLKSTASSIEFVKKANNSSTKLGKRYKNLSRIQGRLITDRESEQWIKYVLNYSALDTMQQDIKFISTFVLMPLVSDKAIREVHERMKM
jgi:hypothetical protein